MNLERVREAILYKAPSERVLFHAFGLVDCEAKGVMQDQMIGCLTIARGVR